MYSIGGLDTFSSIPTIVYHDSKSTVPFPTRKENRTQFTTEDTLRAVKELRYIQSIESIQDSMYENNKALVKLLDKLGDKLENVVDVVEDLQRETVFKKWELEKDQTVEIETFQEITTKIEIEIEGTGETITKMKVEMTAEIEIDIEIDLTQEMKEIGERIIEDLEKVKDTLTRMNSVTTVTEQVIQHICVTN